MEKRDKKELSPVETFVANCLAYSGNAVRIAALKEEQAGLVSANGELRKAIVPFFKEHKDDKWSSLGKSIKAAIVAAGVKDVDGLLGVLKTSFEKQVMPTQQNADRFRKLETWVSWNGAIVPNTYNKVHKPKTDDISDDEAEKQVDALVDKIEKQVSKEGTKKLNAIGNALALATMEAGAGQTPPKVPSISPVKAQKDVKATVPLHANVSGDSEAPISPREHCGILLDQLFKNDAFRSEFAPILAMCLDSNVATVTRCLVEARDAMLNGGKV